MRENEQRKLTEMNNKNIREIKNHTRIIRNKANLSPILNNNRNIINRTSENRPTRLFTEEYSNNNRLYTSNNLSTNWKRSTINMQILTEMNIKRKPPMLAAGSSALQYLDWADAMEKFLKVCGNLHEWLHEDKSQEIMNNDDEY